MTARGGLLACFLAFCCAGGGAAQEAGSGQFRFLQLADGGLWVIDILNGEVSRCRREKSRGARVVDIVEGRAVTRTRAVIADSGEPICAEWVAVAEPRVRR